MFDIAIFWALISCAVAGWYRCFGGNAYWDPEFSNVEMEAAYLYETPVSVYNIRRCKFPEVQNLSNADCECRKAVCSRNVRHVTRVHRVAREKNLVVASLLVVPPCFRMETKVRRSQKKQRSRHLSLVTLQTAFVSFVTSWHGRNWITCTITFRSRGIQYHSKLTRISEFWKFIKHIACPGGRAV